MTRLLPLLLVLSGCYLHTPMEPPELCYTLMDLVVSDGCTATDVAPWEAEVFMHDVPADAIDDVWLEDGVLYQLHRHGEELLGGYVTVEGEGVLGGQCRVTFMIHPCEASHE